MSLGSYLRQCHARAAALDSFHSIYQHMKIAHCLLYVITFIASSCGKASQTEDATQTSAPIEKQNNSTAPPGKSDRLTGTYTFQESGSPDLVYALRLFHQNGLWKGVFFGPSPEGEHGLFFFYADFEDIQVDDAATVDFRIRKGKLYQNEITLDNYTSLGEDNGYSRTLIHFSGQLTGDTLRLTCASEYDLDWDYQTMDFIKQ
jgi:hypothetical protein